MMSPGGSDQILREGDIITDMLPDSLMPWELRTGVNLALLNAFTPGQMQVQ